MKQLGSILAAALVLGALVPARAELQTVLLLENIGLKNTYQVVFNALDDKSADGVFQVVPQDDDSVASSNQVLPFHADIKRDPKDKNVEILDVRSVGLVGLYPPADRKDAGPHVVWRLLDRTGMAPKLKVKIWGFGKSSWELQDMEFVKPKP